MAAAGRSGTVGLDASPLHADHRSPSGNQERFWFLDQYEGDSSVLNLSCVLDIRGDVAEERIVVTLQSTVARHPVLQQRFFATPTGTRCALVAGDRLHVELVDAGASDAPALQKIVRAGLDAPLNLQTGVSISARLVRAPERRLLCLAVHPCVADAHSLRILAEEFLEALEAGTDAHPAPLEEFGYFEKALPTSEDEQAAERYWSERVGVDPAPIELPRRASRPARKRFAAQSVQLVMPAAVINAVDRLSLHLQAGFADVCFAGFISLLRRWSQQETVTVGRVADGRSPLDARSVGPFENLLPVRADFGLIQSFADFVRDFDAHLAQDRLHEALAFDRIAKLLQKSRDPSRNPVFQAVFRYIDTAPIRAQSGSWSVTETAEFERLLAPYDLSLEVIRRIDSGAARIVFDPELFDSEKMATFGEHFLRLLAAAAADPAVPLELVPILDAAEVQRQIEVLNPVATPVSARTVVDLFRSTAQRTPAAPAVSFAGTTLSYEAFDLQTDAMAARLRGRGVTRDVCVGVCLDRSIDMVASVVAILKAGGAYVPMDPSYPPERLAAMAEDARTAFVIVGSREALSTNSELRARTSVLPYGEIEGPSEPEVPTASAAIDGDALAYVIFTSGSTGRPKGVAMPHGALANLIEWQLERKTFRPEARVLQYSSLSFDVSFQELFSTWASGGHLYLISDEDRRDPRRLLETLQQLRIERLFLPYVALRQMVDVAQATQRAPTSLKEVITAGEQLRVDDTLRAFFASLGQASLDNQYGPSETHVVTAHLLEGDPKQWPDLPPIGVPIRNTQVFVLDAQRALVPEGVSGELYLAGANLARGYIGRDDLTNERFVPHPFDAHSGARAYRTGDSGRYGSDGSIEFLGRLDHQVKIRGYRIEPGEVSAVLSQFAGVMQCLTTAVDGGNHGKRLVSYLLVSDPETFPTTDILEYARTHLPSFMVPASILALASFPFTPSGKVDVRSLPLPESMPSIVSLVPATSATQATLVEIWRNLLELDQVGVRDSFFDLGGDSLTAVQVFLAIERRFGLDLPLSLLAENPTIESLARIIDAGGSHDLSQFRSLRVIQRGDATSVPLFMIHGGGGNVVLFRDLAANLGKRQPVYAFEWDGWSSDRGRQSIEEMASLYAAELMRFQPEGAIRLGGHCIGGLIAIEVAGILRANNRRVIEPLIITDAPNLGASTHRGTVPDATDGGAFAELTAMRNEIEARVSLCPPADSKPAPFVRPARSVTAQRAARLVGRVHRLLFKSKFRRAGVEDWVDDRYVRLCLMFGLPMPKELRATYCSLTMVKAARRFRSRGYAGDILFFRTRTALGGQMGLPGWWVDPYFGFDELCRGKFVAHFINSEHNEVVGHQNTAALVREAVDSGSIG